MAATPFTRTLFVLMAQQYVCSACQAQIRDHVVLECDRKHFHPQCLKCACCQRPPLDSARLYAFNGLLLCADDYRAMRSACHVCGQRIEPQDYRFRTLGQQSCHVTCMSCATCRASLQRGDKYVVTPDQRLLCHKCHAQTKDGPAVGGAGRGRGRKRHNIA